MDQHKEFMLDAWRATGRHTDIATLTTHIAQLLGRWVPVQQVLVRRIEPERGCIETVGVGPESFPLRPLGDRSDCAHAPLQRLLAWCRHAEVTQWRHGGRTDRTLAATVPAGMEGELLIGPLASDHGTYGLVLLLAATGQYFTPFHERILQELLEPLAVALENDRRLRELTALREAAEADKQSLVSRSDVPVLLLGETGSGKEVIARAIHARSARAAGPFIRVNCGAIPPDLIDSELFGHEKGSFTGAIGTRRGWFERADEGTLFLDEIGELPLAAQVRLLRVLQEGVFERVGGERALTVDVRIVAATQQDLATRVQHGSFREDLWYRIAVFTIVLPPLREHPQEIAALAAHFARRAAVRFGLTLQLPSPPDIALLTSYAWPGNVRELIAVIDRAAILGAGKGLEVAKALGVMPSGRTTLQITDRFSTAPSSVGATLIPLDAALQRHIEAALAETYGRIEGPYGAARL